MAKATPPKNSVRLSGISLGTDREVPTEFRIFKAGDNPSEKGLFVFTKASAESVMSEYRDHAKPMLLDYNHGTTLQAGPPEASIAAGEFTPEVRNGELWATNIRWTDRAKALLSAGEYRLFSPFFTHDKKGQVLRLVNVALTNLPALDGIEPLVAASATHDHEENDMACEMCTALTAQLSAAKTECDALKAKCSAMEKDNEPDEDDMKASALRVDVAKLTGQSDVPAVIGVISAWKASHEKCATLSAELETIKGKAVEGEFTAKLDSAVAGKLITPAQKKDFWEVQCRKDGKVTADGLAMLSAFVATAKPVVDDKETPAGGDKGGAGAPVALTGVQKEMAVNLSIDPAKFAAYKAEKAARAQ
jgi:phage I-like protein